MEEDAPPFIRTPIKYLDNSVKWARKFGLKVLIDLHGLPGSQNGFDNSGQFFEVLLPSWNPVDKQATKYIRLLAERYKNDTDTVTGLQPVNEPFPVKLGRSISDLESYFINSYKDVRTISGDYSIFLQG